MKEIAVKIKDFLKFSRDKNVSTLSGALSFFLFTGVVPFCFLMIVIIDKLGIEREKFSIILNSIFGELAKDVTMAIDEKRETFFLCLISIYSSSGFYYHLIKSGEKIYGVKLKKPTKKRIFSLFYMFIVQIIMLLMLIFDLIGSEIFKLLKTNYVIKSISESLVKFVFNMLLCFALHKFSSPQNYKNSHLIKGEIFTFTAWELVGVGYYIYLNITTKINSSSYLVRGVVFTLYLYLLMQSLCYGIAINSYFFNKKQGCNTPQNLLNN